MALKLLPARKSQAAMEYLTTYGVAVLVLSVVVVALFRMNVFGGGSAVVQNVCTTVAGFSCSAPILATNGILSSSIGEIGQTTMTITQTGCGLNATDLGVSWLGPFTASLSSGLKTQLSFQCPLPTSNSPLGTQFNGYLWITYYLNSNPAQTLVQRVGQVKSSVATIGTATGSGSPQITFTASLFQSTGTSIAMATTGGTPNYWLCGDIESLGDNSAPNYYLQEINGFRASAAVGYSTTNSCRDSDAGQFAGAIIGVNVPGAPTPTFYYGMTGSNMAFTTSSPTFTVIMVLCEYGSGCTPASGGSISGIPSSCNSQSPTSITTSDTHASASLFVCSSLPAGSYSIYPTGGNGMNWLGGAWVFPLS